MTNSKTKLIIPMTTAKVILYSYLTVFAILGAMVLFSLSLPIYGQQSTTTTTAPTPTVATSPTPNLQYLPQKAYIVTTPDEEVRVSSEDDYGRTGGVVGIIAAIVGTFYAKYSANKENKTTNSALLNTKEVQKEIARVLFNFQPEQSKALSDAPAIKLENLEKDKQQFAEKVAKS